MATQTTGGGSTVSFGNTPQANADVFSFTEDASNILILNVLANDLGGAAKTLFSLDDGTSASASTKSYAPADLLVKDVAYSSDAAGMAGTGDRSALGARIWIESDGTVHYDKGDINAQLQALAAGQTLTDTFTYAIQMGNGTLSWATVTLQFNGVNDAVYMTSSPQSGSVVEDAPSKPDPSDSLNTAGSIGFTDVDLSDTHTATFVASPANTTSLGTFSLDPVNEAANAANGSVQWHYNLNNAAAQYLAAGQTVTESFVVTINDGHGSTATQTVTVTITGTNDAATVSSDSKSVTEGNTAAALNTSGQLTITDPDTGQAHVVAQSNVHGSYGDFSIDANGAWSYIGNGAHNELTAGQQVQDQFTVVSQDGTATGTVTVTITGTNDAATVSSDSKSVTEGNTAAALNTSGQLSITDPDSGEAHVVTQTNAHGTYGDFTIDANGAWSYIGNGAHNELTAGQQVQDQFTVTSQDGTATCTVTVTITGTNDAATVSSDSKSVTEGNTAAALNTSGQLTITDPDTGEAHVVAQSNVHGSYGDFSIDANGAWSYIGNGAHNELTAGQQVQDQFTVMSQDGTATGTVTVTITGTNDAATVSSDSKAVTEADTAAALNTSGQLTIVDPDTGEAHVLAQTNVHGTYGDFSIDANGAWSYTGNGAHNELTAGQQVQDQFTVTSQDGTASGTVTVTITGTNDAATVSSDAKSVTEGNTAAALNASGQLTIVDPDTGEAHVVAQSNVHGTYGDFTIDANGAWSYIGNGAHNELTAGQQVQDQFTVTSQDGTASGTVTVTITGTNDAATVSSDSKSVTEGDTAAALNSSGQLTITDPDTGEAHVLAQSNVHGSYGDFSIDANGAWSYTGNGAHNELTAGQQVQDQFTVVSQDGTATGTVTVTITGTNDAATVSSDSKAVTEADTAAALNTSGQLTIADPDTGEAHVVAQSNVHGSYGDFSIDANGAWSYIGNGAHNELTAGQQVQDQFTVVSQDGTATGTVTVTITGTNDAATVSSDSKSVTEGNTAAALNTSGQLTITDPDTGEAHVVAQANVHGTYGDFSIDANGAWSYTGNGAHNELTAGQQVQDQFTVMSQDGTATGTVTVTITGTNDAATVSSDSKSVTEGNAAAALNTSGQLTITDPDTGEAHVVAQSNVHGTYGDFSIDANGAWSYAGNGAHNELTAGQQVQDQFTVVSQDGTATGTVTVTITGTNDAATVSSDSKSVTEGNAAAALNTSGQLTITDPDTGEAHVVAQSNVHGTYGDFSIDANGAWSYTGNGAHNELTAGQQVQDQFTVVSQDGTATGTVTVTITGTNDAATVSSDSKSVTEGNTAAALNTSGQLTITDPDTGQAHVLAQTNVHGTYGDFNIDANGTWSYTGNGAHNELSAGQQVQDQFTVVSQDGTATGTVTVTITGTNDAATVSSDSKSVTEGNTAAALNTSGQLTITDPDTGQAHVLAQTNVHGTYGDFNIDANGTWSYSGNGAHNELTAGQQVQDQFTVTSQDGTATGTVTVTITGTNDAATVSSDSKSVTEGNTAAALNTSGQLTITDPDTGEAHVIAQTNAHGSYGDFSIDANGAWSYIGNGAHNELTAGQQVQDQFTVVSQDGTATGTVTVTITGTNDAATVSSDSKSVTEGNTAAALNTSGQLTITDPDTGEAHVVAQANVHGTYGDFSIDANGAWSYTGNGAHNELTAGQQVQDQFTVVSQDGTATGTVTVTITGTNDAATVSSDSKSVTEGNTAAALNTSGQLTITDPDTGQAHVLAQTNVHGTYGDFNIDANGTWSYTGNGAHNELSAGQQVQDQFTVVSQDGTATGTVTVTITGTNDAPIAVNDTSASPGATAATEKGGTANGSGGINGSGNVLTNDTDVDSGSLTVSAIRTGGIEGAGTAGTLGVGLAGAHGTLALNANGSYTYVVNENDATVQALNVGQSTTDTFNYTVTDGSLTDTAVLTVTISGANDAPVNTVPGQQAVGNGSGGGSTATFTLRVNDVDNGIETVSLSLGSSSQTSTGILTLSTTSGLTFSSGANGTKTMTFSGSISDINAALAGVTFSGGSNNTTRTLTMTTTDGGGLADTDTVTIVKGSGATVLAPAGIAGEAIYLALSDPSDDPNDVITVTISGVPLGWSLSNATNNGDGTWTAHTNDVQSMTITSPLDFAGAVVLNVTQTWTNTDGTTGTATVADNVEAYAKGSPIFAVSSDDHLTASSGNDLLVFAQPIGHDVVYNFDAMHDQIDLIDYATFTSFADVQAHTVSDASGNAVIELGEGQSITLQGLDPTSLTSSNFMFDQTPVTENSGSLVIGDGALLPLSGTIDNRGTIELNSTGNRTSLELIEHGITLQGHGQVALSDSDQNLITGTTSDVTLTNVDNTIAGAGHLGDGMMGLVNKGTIVATGVNVLDIDTGTNAIVNSGTLEATGSGGMVIDSNLDNSGLLWAHGANITVNGSVTGGGTALMDGVATFEFGAASSTKITLDAGATGTIVLHDSFDFSGLVSGFDGNDHLDLLDVAFGVGTTASYVANQAGTGGTLSVTDGVHTTDITLLGQYDAAGFHTEADKNTGTLISYHDYLV
ncbi:VCBS domain-containing protein [Bradyrhizobium sp. STM 3561]|uniref:VCBS domain-containing protein n=1 Tax=Bradyrhizobium sp. STM 3561 TaxID=578923 RepID=UPI00388E6A2D